MTVQEALAFGHSQLRHTSPTPALDARLLLQYLLGVDHSFLVAHDDEPLTIDQEQQYQALISRARQKEPIPYITGTAPFYGLDFLVTPAVLIPRPETEQMVDAALVWARERLSSQPDTPLRLVDVGTGSGCIAIILARNLPQARVDAVDVSADALAIARQNAQRYAPSRVHFHLGHLLTPVDHQPDLITANLPYIGNEEWTTLDDGVKLYEPVLALRGGPGGLEVIEELLKQATLSLSAGGAIFLEVGWQQGPAARQLAQSYFPEAQVGVIPDYAGRDRIIALRTG
ncbi:MAG TPA: peptide chain release factor N(5)-glutamine methyltransferase [Anaerolineae bacterium]